MSETPQEQVTRWLDDLDEMQRKVAHIILLAPEVREAIRAVLEDLRLRDIDCGCNNRVTRLEAERQMAEAEVERLKGYMTPGQVEEAGMVMAEYEKRIKAEAERDALRAALQDMTFDEWGAPTCWPNQERVMALLAEVKP